MLGIIGHHCIPKEELGDSVQIPWTSGTTTPSPFPLGKGAHPSLPHCCQSWFLPRGRASLASQLLPQPAHLMHAWAGSPTKQVLPPEPSHTGATPPWSAPTLKAESVPGTGQNA